MTDIGPEVPQPRSFQERAADMIRSAGERIIGICERCEGVPVLGGVARAVRERITAFMGGPEEREVTTDRILALLQTFDVVGAYRAARGAVEGTGISALVVDLNVLIAEVGERHSSLRHVSLLVRIFITGGAFGGIGMGFSPLRFTSAEVEEAKEFIYYE